MHVRTANRGGGSGERLQFIGAATAWLTDTYPKKTKGVDVWAGPSIYLVLAQHFGREKPARFLTETNIPFTRRRH